VVVGIAASLPGGLHAWLLQLRIFATFAISNISTMVKLAFVVFMGSGIGGVCRFLLSDIANKLFSKSCQQSSILSSLPFGTFLVNVIGCFIIGLIYGLIDKNVIMSQEAKILLTTGFCGGLTTFSTFSHENLLLFNGGNHITLVIYAIASLMFGFTFAWLGHLAAR